MCAATQHTYAHIHTLYCHPKQGRCPPPPPFPRYKAVMASFAVSFFASRIFSLPLMLKTIWNEEDFRKLGFMVRVMKQNIKRVLITSYEAGLESEEWRGAREREPAFPRCSVVLYLCLIVYWYGVTTSRFRHTNIRYHLLLSDVSYRCGGCSSVSQASTCTGRSKLWAWRERRCREARCRNARVYL